MPSAIIVDDEPLLRRELRETLADLWPELAVAGEYADGAAALVAVQQDQPDVAFLDIRMPKLSGLEVAERIQGESLVVFVTAYDEHAVAAFEQGAADYLLKPVRPARMAATVARLRQRLAQRKEGNGGRYLQRIQATVGNTLRFFAVEEICCFRSDLKYTRVVTAGAEGLIRRPLSAL
jgi:DNA-binding LytR/AlgR family response regulator